MPQKLTGTVNSADDVQQIRSALVMSSIVQKFKATPVFETPAFEKHEPPTSAFTDAMSMDMSATMVAPGNGISVDNRYFLQQRAGAKSAIYLRNFVFRQLLKASRMIGPTYGFAVFDGYRTNETQVSLFDSFAKQIRGMHLDWTDKQVIIETQKYVALPHRVSQFEIPPHNSGGAVDLSLTRNGEHVNMGTEFDDLTGKAATAFFEVQWLSESGISWEQWTEIQSNRRILFHALKSVGFSNCKDEWWHYELGTSSWAEAHGVGAAYDSMDSIMDCMVSE